MLKWLQPCLASQHLRLWLEDPKTEIRLGYRVRPWPLIPVTYQKTSVDLWWRERRNLKQPGEEEEVLPLASTVPSLLIDRQELSTRWRQSKLSRMSISLYSLPQHREELGET